nr:protein qutg [Quercus suber]
MGFGRTSGPVVQLSRRPGTRRMINPRICKRPSRPVSSRRRSGRIAGQDGSVDMDSARLKGGPTGGWEVGCQYSTVSYCTYCRAVGRVESSPSTLVLVRRQLRKLPLPSAHPAPPDLGEMHTGEAAYPAGLVDKVQYVAIRSHPLPHVSSYAAGHWGRSDRATSGPASSPDIVRPSEHAAARSHGTPSDNVIGSCPARTWAQRLPFSKLPGRSRPEQLKTFRRPVHCSRARSLTVWRPIRPRPRPSPFAHISFMAAAEIDLDGIYRFAIDVADGAARLLHQAMLQRCSGAARATTTEHIEKESSVDLVTQTDEGESAPWFQDSPSEHGTDLQPTLASSPDPRPCRPLLSLAWRSHQGRACFIGEESYSKGTSRDYLVGDEPTWCVDPLDAFLLNGKPVVGVVNAPFLRQTFSACRGKGAWLNETQRLPLVHNPVPPMPENAPKGCIFSCEWGKDRKDSPDGNLHRKVESFVTMAMEVDGRGGKGGMVHGVRSLGSATLDLAYVAMGSFDIWWEGGCWCVSLRHDSLFCTNTNLFVKGMGRCRGLLYRERGGRTHHNCKSANRSNE